VNGWLGYSSAAIVTVLAWFAAQFIGGPLVSYRKLRTDIARTLILYANVTQTQTERWNEARRIYREQASTLMGCANDIKFLNLLAKTKLVPTLNEISTVKGNLIGLSNAIGLEGEGLNNSRRQETIERILKIRT
jgi:hypothetical protein